MFNTEYLVRKTAADRDYEDVVKTLGSLKTPVWEFAQKKQELEQENVAGFMRAYWKLQ